MLERDAPQTGHTVVWASAPAGVMVVVTVPAMPLTQPGDDARGLGAAAEC